MREQSSEVFRPNHPNVAYVGEGVVIKGEFSAPEMIVVDGTIEGTITAQTLIVGPSGSIKGNITATEVDVHAVSVSRKRWKSKTC